MTQISRMSDRLNLTASAFKQLGQYTSSPRRLATRLLPVVKMVM